jgi:hypothetical protein
MEIHYYGCAELGYTAKYYLEGHGAGSVDLKRSPCGKKWVASYYGNPYSIAHPECRYVMKDGSRVQECVSPIVQVPGEFGTRKAAVDSALALKVTSGEYIRYVREGVAA